eukprot:scaffold638_cov382-Prasinococcus_capsulatus_cf.AAC.16
MRCLFPILPTSLLKWEHSSSVLICAGFRADVSPDDRQLTRGTGAALVMGHTVLLCLDWYARPSRVP